MPIYKMLFYHYICRVLSRISILSFVVALSVLLCGECRAESAKVQPSPFASSRVELTICDADMPTPLSLLLGKDSSRTINSVRRTLQRGVKRIENLQISIREAERAIVEHSHKPIQLNILGGVVAERAFYSLCCLRI